MRAVCEKELKQYAQLDAPNNVSTINPMENIDFTLVTADNNFSSLKITQSSNENP
jgi:hypothetical protein